MPLLPALALAVGDAVAVSSSCARSGEARDAVDRLASDDFPVDELEIIGSDLRTVERVTGTVTTRRAALSGGAGGAWIGLLVGLSATGPAWLGLGPGGVLIGAACGATPGVVAGHLMRGHHDLSSLSSIAATRYDVIAPDELAPGPARRDVEPRQAHDIPRTCSVLPAIHARPPSRRHCRQKTGS